jgi:hypothetical protein
MLFAFKPEQTYGQSKEQRINDFCQTWQQILKSRNDSPKKKIRKVWPLGARTSKFPISTKLGDPRKLLSPGSSLKSPVATHPRAFGKGKRSFGEWTHNPLLITFRGIWNHPFCRAFCRVDDFDSSPSFPNSTADASGASVACFYALTQVAWTLKLLRHGILTNPRCEYVQSRNIYPCFFLPPLLFDARKQKLGPFLLVQLLEQFCKFERCCVFLRCVPFRKEKKQQKN